MNEDKTGRAKDWRDEKALQRYQIIAPLQSTELDPAKKIALRRAIAEENNLCEKTLRRYEKAYQQGGFHGLRPRDRACGPSAILPGNFEELLAEAIQLRREVPTRSVEQIIL